MTFLRHDGLTSEWCAWYDGVEVVGVRRELRRQRVDLRECAAAIPCSLRACADRLIAAHRASCSIARSLKPELFGLAEQRLRTSGSSLSRSCHVHLDDGFDLAAGTTDRCRVSSWISSTVMPSRKRPAIAKIRCVRRVRSARSECRRTRRRPDPGR